MNVDDHVRTVRETLRYLRARVVEVEALCDRVRGIREAIDSASEDLEGLEARPGGPSLRELEAILDRVGEAQEEWESFARRLRGLWAPGRVVH